MSNSVSWRPPGLLVLAPVCSFGFLLCPYLDTTFHRAVQEAPRPGSAFLIGFGVLFLAMIVGTLVYAPWSVNGPLLSASTWWSAIVIGHLVPQPAFTMGVHQTEASRGSGTRWWTGVSLPAAAVLLVFLLRSADAGGSSWLNSIRASGLSIAEIVYRVFMSFYGLVFPAYVWLCMIPTPDGHHGPRRDKLLVWAGAVGIAAPMFWMGFIERHTWWLGPGLLVVLLARLVVRRLRALPA